MCRLREDDAALTRAGRSSDGVWYLGRGSGRGLWWCTAGECVRQLRVGNAQKALRRTFTDDEVQRFEAFAQSLKMAVDVKE